MKNTVTTSIITAVLLSALVAPLASTARAEDKPQLQLKDSRWNKYDITINEHGAILKAVKTGEVLFVGKDCDVSSEKHGKGLWKWSDAGIIVTFQKKRIIFGRQKLAIQNSGQCKMSL